MKISVLTLFPEMFEGFLTSSIIKRAIDKKLVQFDIVNIRDFSKLNNQQVDDTPYGGGPGMVMMVEPVVDAIRSVKKENSHIVFLTPSGKTLKQAMAKEYAKMEHLILICGHYEGIDERILYYIDEEVSIGDYVLTGGELPSMVLSDAIVRLLDGVIKKESIEEESFNEGMLDYPVYTKPPVYEGHEVPEVLLSGNHKFIAEWREKSSREKTEKNRPDLLK